MDISIFFGGYPEIPSTIAAGPLDPQLNKFAARRPICGPWDCGPALLSGLHMNANLEAAMSFCLSVSLSLSNVPGVHTKQKLNYGPLITFAFFTFTFITFTFTTLTFIVLTFITFAFITFTFFTLTSHGVQEQTTTRIKKKDAPFFLLIKLT